MNKKIIIIGLLLAMFSCDEYLDIVPDQTQQIDLLFERKEVAYTALATCYAYLPKNDGVYTSFMMMSDEVTTPISKETDGIRKWDPCRKQKHVIHAPKGYINQMKWEEKGKRKIATFMDTSAICMDRMKDKTIYKK